MDPIRVIGRIDLAQQIHAVLVAAGADARLATAAPGAVLKETGRDGTGIDVLANGFELCLALKKAAPGRPVVIVTFDETGSEFAEAYADSLARTSRGPDVHLPWPATGCAILEACERAVERARVPRPRFNIQDVAIRLVGVGMLVALIWFLFPAGPARRLEPLGPRARLVASLLQAAVFGASAWWGFQRARKSQRPGWHRGWALFSAAFSGLSLLGGALALLE